jgi:hypothetical protein
VSDTPDRELLRRNPTVERLKSIDDVVTSALEVHPLKSVLVSRYRRQFERRSE